MLIGYSFVVMFNFEFGNGFWCIFVCSEIYECVVFWLVDEWIWIGCGLEMNWVVNECVVSE